jgi:hypothetical protein
LACRSTRYAVCGTDVAVERRFCALFYHALGGRKLLKTELDVLSSLRKDCIEAAGNNAHERPGTSGTLHAWF